MRSWAGLSGRSRLKEGLVLRFYLLVSWDAPATGATAENDDLRLPPPVSAALCEGTRHAKT